MFHWNFQYILPKAEEQRGFAIVGYSYGSLIAIELVNRLEKRGLNGRLVLIDGAPEQMKAVVEQFISSSEEALQNEILLAIMGAIQSTSSGKVDFIRLLRYFLIVFLSFCYQYSIFFYSYF